MTTPSRDPTGAVTRVAASWFRAEPLPRELLELDPVRDQAVGAQAALLVVLIGLEVALEPLHVAVALEGEDVGAQAVEEPAVVADDHGATGEFLQGLLQVLQGLDVEV